MFHRRKLTRSARLTCAIAALAFSPFASADDVSSPALLQWFEGTYKTQENRAADFFSAGYGGVWLPPTGRADSGNQSVGYDPYDRFDLGKPGNPTLYGTETGLKTTVQTLQRTGGAVYIDYIINHSGFSNSGTSGFVQAGDYPGFVVTLPNAIDGDYHSGFASGDLQGRLAGLIDIDQRTNHQFIRSPVPGFANNIPAGTTPAFGRLADVPDENNRRFYPDRSLQPILVFDPKTGESNIAIYPFNNQNPMAGDPVPENAMGYLMRNAQWMVQHIGVDGFRVDAAKHVYPFALDYFDRAVYRANQKTNLDGSPRHVFSFLEAYTGDKGQLQTNIRKDINPADPGRVGGNRDVLDFPLFFAMQGNLSGNGIQNSWHNVVNASQDSHDDGLANNGSQAVAFAHSHDDGGVHLSSVAHAYILMRPGNAVVYFNAKEHGNGRDFPKDGRGDALGGFHGNAIPTLVNLRNTHGRGNYLPRLTEKENLAYEREKSALVMLSNRLDSGFDSRTIQTSFAPGTPLIELTGNASDPVADPNNDIPEVLVVNPNGTVNARFLRNRNANNVEIGKGYLIYGVSGPKGSMTLSNVAQTLAPQTSTADNFGSARVSAIDVLKGDSFTVTLNTTAVTHPGGIRDRDADGNNALLRVDEGLDLNDNGQVDHRTPGSVSYGFENFSQSNPGYFAPSGNGTYNQPINISNWSEGYHFIEARAFRNRLDGGPAVYTPFKRTVYVDRLKPISAVDSFTPVTPGSNNYRTTLRSTDLTADNMHLFLDLPASLTDAQVLAMVSGASQTNFLDRDLWSKDLNSLTRGNHALTIVTFEPTGTSNVQRFPGRFTATTLGAGFGDTNFNGSYAPDDVTTFGTVLNSNNTQYNPAAEITGDGLINDADLFALQPRLVAVNASAPTLASYHSLLITPSGSNNRTVDLPILNAAGSTISRGSGSGIVTITGPHTHGPTAQLGITSGTTNLQSDTGMSGANLAIVMNLAGTTVNFTGTQHLRSLTVNGGQANVPLGNNKLIHTRNLTINAGQLNLTDNALILQADGANNATLLTNLENDIAQGRNNGTWSGQGLVYSFANFTNMSLAAIPNRKPNGSLLFTTFRGEPVDANSILVAPSYIGDLNLDGRVSIADYLQMDRGFARSLPGYHNGDLDYSDTIDGTDYFLIDQAFLSQGTPFTPWLAAASPDFSASSSVPEPGAMALLLAGIPFLLRRR